MALRMEEPSRVNLPLNEWCIFSRSSGIWAISTWSFFLRDWTFWESGARLWESKLFGSCVRSPSVTEWLQCSCTCYARCVTSDKGYLMSMNCPSNFVYLVFQCFFHGEYSLTGIYICCENFHTWCPFTFVHSCASPLDLLLFDISESPSVSKPFTVAQNSTYILISGHIAKETVVTIETVIWEDFHSHIVVQSYLRVWLQHRVHFWFALYIEPIFP